VRPGYPKVKEVIVSISSNDKILYHYHTVDYAHALSISDSNYEYANFMIKECYDGFFDKMKYGIKIQHGGELCIISK
jgi:hypothetical protein